MSNDKLELNRRRVLIGLGTIGVASAGAGAGTIALYSDQESSTGNAVQAGTLDLKIDQNDTATTTVSLGDNDNIQPGQSGSGSSTLSNTGSLGGFLNAEISNVSTAEGATPEAEDGGTDMRDELRVTVYFDDDGDTATTSDQTVVVDDYANSISGTHANADHPLGPEKSSNLVVEWSLDRDAGNGIQGDSVSFDITVLLHQKKNQTPNQ